MNDSQPTTTLSEEVLKAWEREADDEIQRSLARNTLSPVELRSRAIHKIDLIAEVRRLRVENEKLRTNTSGLIGWSTTPELHVEMIDDEFDSPVIEQLLALINIAFPPVVQQEQGEERRRYVENIDPPSPDYTDSEYHDFVSIAPQPEKTLMKKLHDAGDWGGSEWSEQVISCDTANDIFHGHFDSKRDELKAKFFSKRWTPDEFADVMYSILFGDES